MRGRGRSISFEYELPDFDGHQRGCSAGQPFAIRLSRIGSRQFLPSAGPARQRPLGRGRLQKSFRFLVLNPHHVVEIDVQVRGPKMATGRCYRGSRERMEAAGDALPARRSLAAASGLRLHATPPVRMSERPSSVSPGGHISDRCRACGCRFQPMPGHDLPRAQCQEPQRSERTSTCRRQSEKGKSCPSASPQPTANPPSTAPARSAATIAASWLCRSQSEPDAGRRCRAGAGGG